jgi:hypothetical protein
MFVNKPLHSKFALNTENRHCVYFKIDCFRLLLYGTEYFWGVHTLWWAQVFHLVVFILYLYI